MPKAKRSRVPLMRCCSVQRNFSPQRFSKKETSLLNLLEEKEQKRKIGIRATC
jgi:hypothetical protein